MSRVWLWAAGVLVILGCAGIVGWNYLTPKKPHNATRSTSSTKVGTYMDYSYVLSEKAGRRERSGEFSPALIDDDTVVVGALNEVMRVAYDDINVTDIQPIVEVLNEKPYVTFSGENGKTLFLLNKRTSGEVGSVMFWREPKK